VNFGMNGELFDWIDIDQNYIINISNQIIAANSNETVTSEIVFHCIFQRWCKSDANYQKLYKS
jgi:hypothetical protein